MREFNLTMVSRSQALSSAASLPSFSVTHLAACERSFDGRTDLG